MSDRNEESFLPWPELLRNLGGLEAASNCGELGSPKAAVPVSSRITVSVRSLVISPVVSTCSAAEHPSNRERMTKTTKISALYPT